MQMETQSRTIVVKNVAIKSIIIGVYIGGWAGLFVAGSEWAYAPAIISLFLSVIGTFIIWMVSKKKSSKVIWFGIITATLFLIISSWVGGLQLIKYAGATGAGFTAIAVGFELIGAFIGAIIFLILGVIIGLISVLHFNSKRNAAH